MSEIVQNNLIRNIAIIAHVDHGKTTLVDHMFRQAGALRMNEEIAERAMDNMDLERERGITISAKNCAVKWHDTKINIVDTPGHADFGGEVERALMMVDGAILLVDSSEGPLPQTRFVLKKALAANLKIIVVINKIDRKDARAEEVLNEVYDLFIDLGATEQQIDFPVLYAIGRNGTVASSLNAEQKDLSLLFETILEHIPGPSYDKDKGFHMLVSNLAYSDYLGRLAVGKVLASSIKAKDSVYCVDRNKKMNPIRINKLQIYNGLKIEETAEAVAGDIIVLAGVENVEIGDTICNRDNPVILDRVSVDEPTISMRFFGNNSPFSGKEGKYVLTSKIGERLIKETLNNVAIKVEQSEEDESFIVKGRGEFQMVIIIETLRREGYEMCVGRPEIIFKNDEVTNKLLEPIEVLYIDCEEVFTGVVTEKISKRKGRMINLMNHGAGRVRIEFDIPSRGLIGYRNEFLTDTKGTGIMNSILSGYEEYRGEIASRTNGSLVSDRQGVSVPYGLYGLEARGKLFIAGGVDVYEGMIIGENNKDNDLNVNCCRAKKLTNVRASGKDENVVLTPVIPMTLEKAIDFIKEDELVEVTPKNIRLRKKILPKNQR